jgi:hypothetical protein
MLLAEGLDAATTVSTGEGGAVPPPSPCVLCRESLCVAGTGMTVQNESTAPVQVSIVSATAACGILGKLGSGARSGAATLPRPAFIGLRTLTGGRQPRVTPPPTSPPLRPALRADHGPVRAAPLTRPGPPPP